MMNLTPARLCAVALSILPTACAIPNAAANRDAPAANRVSVPHVEPVTFKMTGTNGESRIGTIVKVLMSPDATGAVPPKARMWIVYPDTSKTSACPPLGT